MAADYRGKDIDAFAYASALDALGLGDTSKAAFEQAAEIDLLNQFGAPIPVIDPITGKVITSPSLNAPPPVIPTIKATGKEYSDPEKFGAAIFGLPGGFTPGNYPDIYDYTYDTASAEDNYYTVGPGSEVKSGAGQILPASGEYYDDPTGFPYATFDELATAKYELDKAIELLNFDYQNINVGPKDEAFTALGASKDLVAEKIQNYKDKGGDLSPSLEQRILSGVATVGAAPNLGTTGGGTALPGFDQITWDILSILRGQPTFTGQWSPSGPNTPLKIDEVDGAIVAATTGIPFVDKIISDALGGESIISPSGELNLPSSEAIAQATAESISDIGGLGNVATSNIFKARSDDDADIDITAKNDKKTTVKAGGPSILSGVDTLTGGDGADTLTGGDGADIVGGAKTTDGALKTGGRDITAGGAKTTDGALKTGGRDITAGGAKTTDGALKTGGGGEKKVIETGGGGEKKVIETGGGGEKKVIETGGGGEKKVIETGGGGEKKVIETGGEAQLTPLKTGETPPLKTSTTGGGSTGTLTLPPSLRGVREEPGDVVDIDYLYDFAKGLDQPFLTTEEQEMLKDLNVYAEGGEVANEDAVDMLTRPRRPGEYGRSYFTPGQFVPTGTALGGAALNANAIQIPQYTYQRELLPQFGGPAAGVTTPATTTPTTTTPVGTTPTLSDTLGQEGIANLLSNITGMFGGSAGTTPAATTPAATTPAATTPAATTPAATTPVATTPADTGKGYFPSAADTTTTPDEILEFLNKPPIPERPTAAQLKQAVLDGTMSLTDAYRKLIAPEDDPNPFGFTEEEQKALGIHESQRTGQGYKFDPTTGRNRLYDYDSNTYVDTTTTTDTAADTATTGAADVVDTLLSSTEQWMVANRGYIDNGDGTITDSTTGYVYDADTGKGYFPSSTDTTTTVVDTTADTTTTAADTTADTTTTAADTTADTTTTAADTAFDDFASNFYNKTLTKDDLLSIANSGYPVDQIAAKLKVDTNALNTAIGQAQTQDVLDKVDPTDGFSTEEQDAVAQLLAEDKIGLGDITEQYDLGTMDVIESVLRGGYETPAEMVERLAPYNEGLTEEELVIKLLNEGRTTPAEVASYYGVDESLVRERAGLAGGGAIYGQGYYLGGPTDGMADLVPATIDGTQPAALSDGEFVIPADVVSHLGNGNSDAGAKQLYSMMDRVRTERTGTTKQGPEIDPTKMMPA